MSSPSKPVNIRSPPLSFNSAAPTPSGTPDIRALRAQYSGTPPVPNIPARHTSQVSCSISTRDGSPSANLTSNELFAIHRPSSSAISTKRPASAAASGSAADNTVVDPDDAEDKVRVLRRHLLFHGERHPSRTDLRSSDSSDHDTPDVDEPSAASTPLRPPRELSETFPIPYHAPGADVT